MASSSPKAGASSPLVMTRGEVFGAIEEFGDSGASPSRDEMKSYLARQRLLHELAALEEREVSSRLALVRSQHDTFLATAQKYVGLLFRSAEASSSAVEALSWGSATYSPVRMRRARSAPGAPGHGDADYDEDTIHRNSGGMQRMLVTTASASGGPVAVTQVELTGAPQRHRKAVAERRLEKDRAELDTRAHEFEERERRRRESYLRRNAMLLAKVPEKKRPGVDRTAHQAREEWAQQARREEIRAKHDRLEERRRAVELRDRATGDALRHVDHLTQTRVKEMEAKNGQHERRIAKAVHTETLKTSAFREHVAHETTTMHQRRQRAKRDFLGVFQKENEAITKQLQRREHEAVALHAQAVADSLAVDVRWPAELNRPAPKKKTSTIDEERYARLCGVKHSFMVSNGTDVSVADIVRARHVPPSAWGILHAVDPDAAHLTLQGAQASVVRGPQTVSWK